MKTAYIDLETSGLDPKKNGVIQIAGLIDIDGEIKEEFNFKCRPFAGQLCSPEALKLHNLTVEQIREYPDPTMTYSQLLKIFDKYIDRYNKEDKFYMVGQNPKFDYDFLTEWFKNNGNQYFYAYVNYALVDLVAATVLMKIAGIINPENMKLGTLAKSFGMEFDAHDAMADIKMTRTIFYKYVEMIKNGKAQN